MDGKSHTIVGVSEMRRSYFCQRGASAVEFALILSLLIILTFGIIEFGLLMYNKQVITNASREGARAGIVASSPRLPTSQINSIVQSYCGNYLVTFGDSVSPSTEVSGYLPNAAFGNELEVKVTYQYNFLVLPNFIPGIPKSLNLQAVSVMRYE